MLQMIIRSLIILGAGLMIFNIYGFQKFAKFVKEREGWGQNNFVLNLPIALLVMFLLGYLVVGVFGKPDIIMALILFFGSIFVFVMYRTLWKVTDRIIEGESLQSELHSAEQSSQAKNQFLASMSHEMRTPMNVILGIDSIALMREDLDPESREQFEKIGESGRHLLGLINNILDINSIDSGDLTVSSIEFSLKDVLSQVNTIAGAMCEEKGLTYTSKTSDNVSNIYIGDAMQIKQILLTLLDNAVKYTDIPGTVALSADRIETGNGECSLQFKVFDTGIGIDEEFLPHIFELFTKEDSSSSSKYGGSGLGLPAAKRRAELMGGSIEVNSTKGKGSTFTVNIPVRVAVRKAGSEGEDVDTDSISLEGRRILVAEDVPENAEIVMDLLELEGVECEHAENGKIALDMFEASDENYYDAILMDLRMPVMDGLESARRIRHLDRIDAVRIPILALTANAYESDVKASLEAGMNVHMAKPVGSEVLYDTIKKTIAKAQLK